MKRTAILVMLMFATFLGARSAHVVPAPSDIAWTAPPATFVTSLYNSVLGRAPENPEVVAAWSAQVTSSPGSRLRVFWGFVGSPEYRNTAWSRQPREYTLYRRYDIHTSRVLWAVSKGPLAEYIAQAGPYTFGVAMAVRNYHAAFASRR